MEKTTFNSSVSREDYAIIRDEAYKYNLTIKQHISNILSMYAKQKREEESNASQITKQQ
jgi:hypothetical protein